MMCPHCLIETNTIFQGRCSHCGGIKDVFATELHKEIAISGLEKIKPLDLRYVSKEYWNAVEENRAKLNEVIENQNKIINYLDKEGKK